MFNWISSTKLSVDPSPSNDGFSPSPSSVLTSRMGVSCIVFGVSLPSSPERFLQHITLVGVAVDGAAAVAFDGAAAVAFDGAAAVAFDGAAAVAFDGAAAVAFDGAAA